MTQAAISSDSVVHINQTTQHHIPEDTDLQSHSCENIKFCILFYVCKLIKQFFFFIMYIEPSSVDSHGSFFHLSNSEKPFLHTFSRTKMNFTYTHTKAVKFFFQYISFQAVKKIWIPLDLNFNFVIQFQTYNSMQASLTQEHIYRYFSSSNTHFSYFTTEYIIFCNNTIRKSQNYKCTWAEHPAPTVFLLIHSTFQIWEKNRFFDSSDPTIIHN